jgi:flagellin
MCSASIEKIKEDNMALTVYQNLYALTSQRYLATNQTALGKSIERLSSGLRINHAADDASGLAISEKMRGQISGMKRAKMNAQDGISYLQTAEGAMEQTSNILQRMRELAVQAANGIYTTNDRLELQKEIDQLKAEIDRISTSTEFNTRKLINGDGTALWSSDSQYISAIVRSPVTEGNYEIAMSVRPGRNEIYKTHIFTLQEGRIAAEITSTANDTNVGSVSNPISLSPTSGSPLEFTIGTNSTTSATAATSSILSEFKQKDSAWTATLPASASGYSAVGTTRSGYFEIEFLEDITSAATGVTGADFRVRFYDAKTGEVGAWQTVLNNPAGNTDNISFVYSDPSLGITAISAAYTITIGSGIIHQGDKLLTAVSAGVPVSTSASVTLAKIGGGTIQISQNGAGPTLVYTATSSLTKADNGDTILDLNAVTVHIAEMDDKTGNINFGNITLNFKEQPDTRTSVVTGYPPLGQLGTTDVGAFQVAVVGGGEAATTTTRLRDITQFVDADGNNVFENKQELIIYGNGQQAVVHIEGNDTIATLVEKLNKAIVEDLDMGSEDAQVNANLVRYITVPDPTGWGTIKGTMLIQTALTGEQSSLSFIGDQTLINALGIATVQSYENNETTVTIRDAHTGNLVGTEVTGDDRIYTLINGIDLVLDSRAGVLSSWNSATNSISFASDPALANQRFHLHLVDNRTSLQIGANKGQHLNVSIPQLDLVGLGLENVTLVSQERAQQAIGKIDRALTMVVSARATVGAQVSRLEHTIENLATATEYLVASESRIRDLDVAEESTTYAKNQILVQSGIAMLAQANQLPQMALTLISGG